jgi:hypothetical protein
LHEAFEFIARFFENSLAELATRNVGVEGRFRRIDANRFTALAYRDGDAVARCSVFLGDWAGSTSGIAYSHNDSASPSSFNENLSVEHDDQTLYLKALGMAMRRQGEGKLSPEGGAELYWSMFIEPLQRSD